MAVGVENYTNIHGADASYPKGDIKDNTGANDGTPVNRRVYADMHQTLMKILLEAGITANNSPDNATNGYQYFSAMLTLFNRYKCTSASSVLIGTGLKAFTVPANMAYQPGVIIRVTDQANVANYMQGVVATYSGTALVINALAISGSGTIAAWNINIGSVLQATETLLGIAEIATQAEVTTGSDDARYVTPLKLKTAFDTIVKTKIVEIGDWNMDSASIVTIDPVPVNYKKIRAVSVIIRDDADSVYYPLDYVNDSTATHQGGVGTISSFGVALNRLTGGIFDGTDFNATGYNRGWITIHYAD